MRLEAVGARLEEKVEITGSKPRAYGLTPRALSTIRGLKKSLFRLNLCSPRAFFFLNIPEVSDIETLPVLQARAGEPAAWDALFRRFYTRRHRTDHGNTNWDGEIASALCQKSFEKIVGRNGKMNTENLTQRRGGVETQARQIEFNFCGFESLPLCVENKNHENAA